MHAENIRDSADGFYGKLRRIVTIAQVVTTGTPMTFDTVAVSTLRGGEAGPYGYGGERADVNSTPPALADETG